MATTLSETMNVKGQRKVVVAKYTTEYIFKLPDGLDLEDRSVVDSWGIKYNTLYIYWVDTTKPTTEIDSTQECEPDYKYPDNDDELKIRDAEDFGYEYSEDEDEEETCGKCNNNLEPSKECFDCEVIEQKEEIQPTTYQCDICNHRLEDWEKGACNDCFYGDDKDIYDCVICNKIFKEEPYKEDEMNGDLLTYCSADCYKKKDEYIAKVNALSVIGWERLIEQKEEKMEEEEEKKLLKHC